jgi:hypothetical protein
VKKVKKLSRAERAFAFLAHHWATSWELAHKVGTITPTKVLSELRAQGIAIKARRRGDGSGLTEYRVARGAR